MMNAKHTPGPWKRLPGDGLSIRSEKRDGHERLIAYCPTQDGGRDYDSAESFANARLIACAPELLQSLRELIHACECNGFFGTNTKNPMACMVSAREAVSKADGSATS